MSRRTLSDDEEALWSNVARSITPMRPAKAKPKSELAAPKSASARSSMRAAPRIAPALPIKSPPLAPLDRRMKQRLARGRDAIEARIDLHGMTQNEAHAALSTFLHRAQSGGKKIALVVTGKGTRLSDGASERGVLRRQVPLWLTLPEFRSLIVGFEEAHVSHGGQGALYVRLRRVR
ncbi:MAG TPA: Smr/MutS family protein [Xanthobacteraceae bacterium]|jgi:DNA-nicking Smr family endonuclease|nr:Smr/MutS family protein [Xanthobacteraceae bacterium]